MSISQRWSTIRSSFQFKLISLFTVVTAVITFLFVTLFVIHQIRQDKHHASEKLQLLTKSFADSIRLPLYAENREVLMQEALRILRSPQIRGVEIVSPNNRVLVRLSSVPVTQLARCLVVTQEVRSSQIAFLPDSVPVSPDRGNLVGRVSLYRGVEDLTQTGRILAINSCALAVLFWLAVAGSSYLLLRRVTRSFQALMRGLQNVHGGDYQSRIEVFSDDEPGRASASVNQLAESLWERERENRRLNTELVAAMDLEIASKERLIAINCQLELEIAERTQVRQELINLVEQLPVGIIWSEADGTIEHLNTFMTQLIGYGAAEVSTVEQWWRLACPDPARRERFAELRRAAIEAWRADGSQVRFYDVQVICKDGSLRELNCCNQLSGSRTVDIMIDMTEREMLQRQIVRNQKLESIGILAGGIAHNFNNALTGVMGYISFARKFVDESSRAHSLLLNAEKATNRAAGLAKQLLTFSNGGSPVRKAVSVPKLVEESVSLATGGSKVSGRLLLPVNLCYMNVDESQIRQAFNCICVNAVQAMPEGGVLTVRGRNVSSELEKLPVTAPGEYVEICFEDHGCGIKDEDKPKIFTPYFTSKAELGTGLGLATVHSIIIKHGGMITFSTVLGEGTTFTLYLPVVKGAAPDGDEAAPASLAS